MNFWTQSEKNIFVAAHRGLSESYPENTIEAFSAAIEAGVDQIETDVRISKDGELVLMHDETVDRTTNGTGAVCDMTLEELKALDAGIKKGKSFSGAKIPTFKEFLELVKDLPKITIDIELKEYPTEGREDLSHSVCDRVLEMIDSYDFTGRCVINTFHAQLHEYIYQKYGKKYKQHVYYPTNYMGECKIDPYSYGYCVCAFGDTHSMPSKSEIDALKEKYSIRVWGPAGIKDEKGVDCAIQNGIELITCNNADVILDLLRKKGFHE